MKSGKWKVEKWKIQLVVTPQEEKKFSIAVGRKSMGGYFFFSGRRKSMAVTYSWADISGGRPFRARTL
jgi:hypothetical protein